MKKRDYDEQLRKEESRTRSVCQESHSSSWQVVLISIVSFHFFSMEFIAKRNEKAKMLGTGEIICNFLEFKNLASGFFSLGFALSRSFFIIYIAIDFMENGKKLSVYSNFVLLSKNQFMSQVTEVTWSDN